MEKIKTSVQNDIGAGVERHIAAERKKKREQLVEGHKSVLNKKQRITRKKKNKIVSNSRKRNR